MIKLKQLLQEQMLGMLSTKPIVGASRFNLQKSPNVPSGRMPRTIDDSAPDGNMDYFTPLKRILDKAIKLKKSPTPYSNKQAKLMHDQLTGNLFDTYILGILKSVRSVSELSSLIWSYYTLYHDNLFEKMQERPQPTYKELLDAFGNIKDADNSPIRHPDLPFSSKNSVLNSTLPHYQ